MNLVQSEENDHSWDIYAIITEIFKVSLISYLIFYLIDHFISGFVTDHFNLNILLIITIVAGVLTVSIDKDKRVEEKNKKVPNCIISTIFGIIGAAIIYLQIKDIGIFSYIISLTVGAIIILITNLLLTYNKK